MAQKWLIWRAKCQLKNLILLLYNHEGIDTFILKLLAIIYLAKLLVKEGAFSSTTLAVI